MFRAELLKMKYIGLHKVGFRVKLDSSAPWGQGLSFRGITQISDPGDAVRAFSRRPLVSLVEVWFQPWAYTLTSKFMTLHPK